MGLDTACNDDFERWDHFGSSAVNFCGHLVVENVQKSPKIEKIHRHVCVCARACVCVGEGGSHNLPKMCVFWKGLQFRTKI